MSYEHQLKEIVAIRQEAYALDMNIIASVVLGLICSSIVPLLAPLFGFIAFVMFYRKLIKAAHVPCPSCGEPFGTSSKWPLGVGLEHCQNCNLGLYDDA